MALVRTAIWGVGSTSRELRSGTTMPCVARNTRTDSDTAGENSTSSKREGLPDGAGVPIKPPPKRVAVCHRTRRIYIAKALAASKNDTLFNYSSELYCSRTSAGMLGGSTNGQ